MVSFNGKKIDNKALFYLILVILFFKCISSEEITSCPKHLPILKSGECYLEYCSQDQFDLNQCKIANSTVETQWLNNIIIIGENPYRFATFATFSSGDMIVETTCNPKNTKRLFYGLQKNGRPFFINKNNNEKTSYFFLNTTKVKDNGQYQLEGTIIKSSDTENNGKEYFISFSKYNGYVEIFDFDNNILYSKEITKFVGNDQPNSYRQAIVPLYNTSTEYYYLYGFVGKTSTKIQKHIFRTINNFETSITYDANEIEIEDAKGIGMSCYKTSLEKIICFYLNQKNNAYYYNLHKFEIDFTSPIILRLDTNYYVDKIFYKCIHLKDEIGIFAYFYKISNYIYPFFLFKEFRETEFINYLNNSYTNSTIVITKNVFYNILSTNDIIKLKDNKIAFVSASESKKILFIIIINILREKKIKIRYYSIQLYDLYHLKIFKDIRIHNYNNYLALAFSFCKNELCSEDNNEHFSALIIFSYPNCNDININLDNYLFDENIDVNNLKIDLKKNIKIDNNIFGYIISNIYIVNIQGPSNDYISYSSKDESKIIIENYKMELDENIIFKYIGSEKYIPLINKTIEYYIIATEPEYNIYDIYPDEIEGENDENDFNKEEYIGKLSYYYIKSDLEYSFNCSDRNCILCKKEFEEYCISCKYGYSLSDTNGKICNESKIDLMTEILIEPITEKKTEEIRDPITELMTEYLTESIREQMTEPITELMTEYLTESITEQMTDPITEKITEYLTESITEQMTDPITEKITEKASETIAERITEQLTERINEKVTEKLIEKITEEIKNDDNSCTKQDILNNKCSEGLISEEQLNKLYIELKQDYLKGNFNGNNTIIQTQNIVFQISTLTDQKNSDNPNVSSIDLGECEKALKDEYGINEDLIIFKTDIKSEDLTQTFVQYEIYDPRDLTLLDLTKCKNMKISVNSPVKLDSSTSSLYDILKESGYNLFNESDAFYTDICSTFTSQNGTDMTLTDRKIEIFSVNGNISLCQNGCELESYNSTTRKAKCECSPQIKEVEISLNSSNDKFDVRKIGEGFMNILKNSNFLVLKCYKLSIDLKTIWSNIGRILMTIIVIISFIFLIIFCFSDRKRIDNLITSIIRNRINNLENAKKPKLKNSNKDNKKSNNLKRKKSNKNKRNSETQKKFLSKSKSFKLKDNLNSAPRKRTTYKINKKSRTFKKNENKTNSIILSKKEILKNNSKRKMLKNNSYNKSNFNFVKINNYNIKNIFEEKKNSKKKVIK